MQYTMVLEEDGLELIKSVKEKIANGWIPQGGVSVTSDIRETKGSVNIAFSATHKSVLIFAQAMVKD